MKKLKIAIVGTGNISNAHISAYLKNENVELYAFCYINEERLKAAGAGASAVCIRTRRRCSQHFPRSTP